MERRGEAQFALQGYYLGASGAPISDTSGVAFSFREFIPNVGLLSASFQGYRSTGDMRFGDSFVQLRGANWWGRRWNVTGGDFKVSSSLVDVPFYNFFYPEINARGVEVESSSQGRRYTFFLGSETLMQGPRVPFRIGIPQMVMGASMQQKIGKRLQIGARFLRLSSSQKSLLESPTFFPTGRDFLSANSFTAQGTYSFSDHLRFFAEATLSVSDNKATEDAAGATRRPLSYVLGPAWETPKLAIRVNYTYQSTLYLPLLGFYVGDRRGPFAEARYRPWKLLEVYGSASRYSNNLENDPNVTTMQSTGSSLGASLTLPWKFNASGQLSTIHLTGSIPTTGALIDSNNRQLSATLSRPVRGHALTVMFREIHTVVGGLPQVQRSLEAGDRFRWKFLSVGASANAQRLAGTQARTSLFFRGNVQARFKRFSIYGDIESGNDLINRTLFATNTYSTTLAGVTAKLSKTWNMQVEMFRNRLLSELNPESIFVLGNQGLGPSTVLSGFNQWSLYFRVSKQLQWGGGLPAGDSETLDRFTSGQMPLVGEVEGFVYERTIAGARPARGVPVSVDGGRSTTTDESGRFRLQAVPEGQHTVLLSPNELPADYDFGPAKEAVVMVQPKRTIRVELDVMPLSFLQGKVNAPKDVSTEDVIIRLLPTDRYTTPDSDGSFSFSNVREGEYEMALDQKTLPEDAVLTTAAHTPVSVRIGGKIPVIQFDFVISKPEKPVRKIQQQEIHIETAAAPRSSPATKPVAVPSRSTPAPAPTPAVAPAPAPAPMPEASNTPSDVPVSPVAHLPTHATRTWTN